MEAKPVRTFLSARVGVYQGDLTDHGVDALVNAANASLLGGGGVDGAIHRQGGPEILAACKEIRRTQWPGGLPTGEAVITIGGRLPAKRVIHTVGPVYGRHHGLEAELLANCYRNCLSLARSHGLRTVAFPAISTGAYGFPADEAARVVSAALTGILEEEDFFEEIRLVFFDSRQVDTFLAAQGFPHGSEN